MLDRQPSDRITAPFAGVDSADYYQDGLRYCGQCRTPRQCSVMVGGQPRIVTCLCACRLKQYEMRKQADKEAQERIRLRQLRAECVQDRQLANCVFASAEDSVNILRCQHYVELWEKMQNQNLGLLFWGEVGGGKTYAAACIANALLDRGVPVMVTSLPRIINSGWDKAEIISQLHRYPLMVLDDLGVERNSEYSLETVYTVLDERRKAQKPLIITTNLTLKEMRAPIDRAHDRIYSRIFEMCVPIHFPPQNYRAQTAASKIRLLEGVLSKESDVNT